VEIISRGFTRMNADQIVSTACGSGRVGFVTHLLPQVVLTSCHGQACYSRSQRTIREKLRSTARVAA